MKRHEVYAKFETTNGNFVFISMDELQDIGDPIDENGVEMSLVDDYVYIYKQGNYKVLEG